MLEYALKEDIALNKAIILVAGMGTRLKPRTDTIHKCLTKVNDIPIIENALTCLKSVGVTEVMLVVGYLRDEIKDEIGNEFNGIKIGYVENSDYATTSTSYSLSFASPMFDAPYSIGIVNNSVKRDIAKIDAPPIKSI